MSFIVHCVTKHIFRFSRRKTDGSEKILLLGMYVLLYSHKIAQYSINSTTILLYQSQEPSVGKESSTCAVSIYSKMWSF